MARAMWPVGRYQPVARFAAKNDASSPWTICQAPVSASATATPVPTTVNSTSWPSGRNCGHRWKPVRPAAPASVSVKISGSPPAAETRNSPPLPVAVNTMVSSLPHVAPGRLPHGLQIVETGPPATSTFRSVPAAKKPNHSPSGEKHPPRSSSLLQAASASIGIPWANDCSAWSGPPLILARFSQAAFGCSATPRCLAGPVVCRRAVS